MPVKLFMALTLGHLFSHFKKALTLYRLVGRQKAGTFWILSAISDSHRARDNWGPAYPNPCGLYYTIKGFFLAFLNPGFQFSTFL
jgi:hypothetical protein